MKKILFIGAGRMAQAIIEGLKKTNEFEITVTNSGNENRLTYVKEAYSVKVTSSWEDEVNQNEIIVLAMPPDAHPPILKTLASLIDGELVITVAAGIGPSALEANLPYGTPTAWVMPNTAAKLGESMTLFAVGQYIKETHIKEIEKIVQSIGDFERVTENQIHELTALTGSAPAFIYRVAEALEGVAMDSGISHEQARKLISQMIMGSALMLKTQADPQELALEVATPGGSTAEGLAVLESGDLSGLLGQAIKACREKVRVQ